MQEQLVYTQKFGSTFDGRLYSVLYSLSIFVKHDSWNQFGEGNCISVPLRIKQQGITSVVEENKPFQNWNPKKSLRKKLTLESLGGYEQWYLDHIIGPKREEWKKNNVINFLTPEL